MAKGFCATFETPFHTLYFFSHAQIKRNHARLTSLAISSAEPGKVRNLTVTPDDRSLRLTWEDPGDTPPTGELDRVSIDVSNTCKRLWTYNEPIHNLINGSGKWAFTVRHLQPDSDYTIEVREVERAQRSRRRVPVSVSDAWSV